MAPKRIVISKSKALLTIDWQNGDSSKYSFIQLRAACPCAECQAHHEDNKNPKSSEILHIPIMEERSLEIVRVERVGNYGLQIYWSDGHSHGIYSWAYLMALCPPIQKVG
jgi:DUF971 family protein